MAIIVLFIVSAPLLAIAYNQDQDNELISVEILSIDKQANLSAARLNLVKAQKAVAEVEKEIAKAHKIEFSEGRFCRVRWEIEGKYILQYYEE